MSLSGYLAWKGINETCGVVMGYVNLVGCGVVNTVYGCNALCKFLDEMTSCCKTTEAKQMIRMLSSLHCFNESVGHMSDDVLCDLITSGEISETVLASIALERDVYAEFLPLRVGIAQSATLSDGGDDDNRSGLEGMQQLGSEVGPPHSQYFNENAESLRV